MCARWLRLGARRERGPVGPAWAPIEEAAITLDHATHSWSEHSLRLDFADTSAETRAAVELDLPSAKTLLERLQDVVAAADRASVRD